MGATGGIAGRRCAQANPCCAWRAAASSPPASPRLKGPPKRRHRHLLPRHVLSATAAQAVGKAWPGDAGLLTAALQPRAAVMPRRSVLHSATPP